MKKWYVLAISLLIATSMYAGGILSNGIYFKYISVASPYTVEVTAPPAGKIYNGHLSVPKSVTSNGNSFAVIGVGNNAFTGFGGITFVSLPATLQYIGDNAFQNCVALDTVNIPSSVTSLGQYAFDGCTLAHLSFNLPCHLTSLSNYCFQNSNITSLVLPSTIDSIGNNTFFRCYHLTKITLPLDSLTYIGDNAFSQSGQFDSLFIPKKVSFIGSRAFSSTNTSNINNKVKPFSIRFEEPASLTTISSSTFEGSGLSSVNIPSSVTSIDDYAFYYSSVLNAITIPTNVQKIGVYAFRNSNLQKITFSKPSHLTLIDGGAFYYCNIDSLFLPYSLNSIGITSFNSCSNLKYVEIPSTLVNIGDNAFTNCTGLSTVRVHNPTPSSITLGSNIFQGVPTSSDTLYVPGGSSLLYTIAPQWSDFFTVLEDPKITPVNFVSFSADFKSSEVNLSWQTATELNTKHFVIEHRNSSNNFLAIGMLQAKGSGANSYTFADKSPINGINYYRLKSVDKDGAVTYCKVVSVILTVTSNHLTVFPNPSRDKITVSGNHIASVQVVDNMGRVVSTTSLQDATNPKITVSSLKAGAYHLRIKTTEDKVSVVGFVKE